MNLSHVAIVLSSLKIHVQATYIKDPHITSLCEGAGIQKAFYFLCFAMSDREPTRWQHNRIYPHPINPYVYTYDSICHLQISI